MSAANHTAGPWTCKPTASLGPQWAVYSESDTRGATIAVVYDHDENTEANARLIAACPDLLEVASALMRAESMQQGARDGATMGEISIAIDLARAALRQAGG